MRNDCGRWREGYVELNAPEFLLTDNTLLRLSALNKGVRMERTADGRLIAMPGVGGTIGILNAPPDGPARAVGRRGGSRSRLRLLRRVPPAELGHPFAGPVMGLAHPLGGTDEAGAGALSAAVPRLRR